MPSNPADGVEQTSQTSAKGAPGNKNAVKHGVHSLEAMRRRGSTKGLLLASPSKREKGNTFADLGGDVSVMLLVIIKDTVWSDFYIATYDQYLSGLKSTVRKGRPHPIIDARARLAAHRRENIKLMGLKRVSKTLTLQELLNQPDETKDGHNGHCRTRDRATVSR